MLKQKTIIQPISGWQLVDIRSLWRYRDLLYFLSMRGIKIRYAQSILGVGWAIINPLVQALLFTVIFGNLAKISSDGTPYVLFSFTALVAWTYFSGILTDATSSVVTNRDMIGKVYFPRLILPLAAVLSKLIDFGVAFLVLIGFLIYYGVTPASTVVFLPLLLLILITTSLGAGTFLAALAVQFRDVQYAMQFLVRLLMYSAPVVYPVSLIPVEYQGLYALNPMVGVIEGMRSIFLQTREFPWDWVLTGLGTSAIIFIFGCFFFQRMERHFADVA